MLVDTDYTITPHEQLILDTIPLPTEHDMYLNGSLVKDTRQLTMELTALQGDTIAFRANAKWRIECLERTVESLLQRIGDVQALLSPGVAA